MAPPLARAAPDSRVVAAAATPVADRAARTRAARAARRPAPRAAGGGAGTDGTGRGGQSGTDGARGGQNGAKGGTGGGAAGGTGGVATGGSGGGATGGTGGGTVGCQPACDQMHTCVGTACLLNAGLPCTLAAQCASNACTPFYQDLDGDGYGAGAAAGFCGTTAPVGYATKNGDCCDDPNHLSVAKLIHPNADFQMTSAGGVCNVTWDYDCSGKVDKSAPMYGCDPTSAPPNCRMTTAEYADSTCGTSVAGCGCGTWISGTTCSVVLSGHDADLQIGGPVGAPERGGVSAGCTACTGSRRAARAPRGTAPPPGSRDRPRTPPTPPSSRRPRRSRPVPPRR